MFQKAFGGGFLTSFTILFKFLISAIGLPSFYAGLAQSINFSGSFLVLHFNHLTLGTKQPAMTAPALAEKMAEMNDRAALESLVDEVVDIIRSQIAAVLGNIAGVLPFTISFCLLWELAFQKTLLGAEKSLYVLESFSILGPTPIYAAFTGVLLWFSSICSGWADNWFAFNQLRAALASNRRLIFVFGEKGAQKLALIAKKNVAAVTSSVSLGFLLGMTPVLLHFLGIPLDVRHVTLSSGSLALAIISFSSEAFPTVTFWLAVAGVASMGVLNILVAFSLALFVAIRARRIQAPGRKSIYLALVKRFVTRPLSFLIPPKK